MHAFNASTYNRKIKRKYHRDGEMFVIKRLVRLLSSEFIESQGYRIRVTSHPLQIQRGACVCVYVNVLHAISRTSHS